MSKADSNEQTDSDILQCKADILRAHDIIPGTPKHNKGRLGNPLSYKAETRREPKSQDNSESTTLSADTAETPELEQVPSSQDNIPAEQEKTEIPSFDLAEKIMAEQRKLSATKRKAPGKKVETPKEEPQAGPISYYTIEQPTPAPSEQEQIIAEIVARDIERLCKGH